MRLSTIIVLLLTAALCLTDPSTAAAQAGPASISGRVIAPDGRPVASASVVLETLVDGTAVSAALSGENGRFTITGAPDGTYLVRVAHPGFQPYASDVTVSPLNRTYDLGEVRLGGFGEEVTVTASSPLRAAAMDSRVVRLGEGAAQSTGSALDALKSLPGITIDQEGRVSLRGSDRVVILVDGQPSALTGFGQQRGLDSISAANIEAIEIIDNPSARFDAAGQAGIINIIYKKEQRLGLTADVGLSLGMGQFTRQRADLPTDLGSFTHNEKIIPNLNLNYTAAKVRTFLQADLLLQDDLPNNEFTTRIYDDGRVIESQVPENREQYHYTVRGGADWKASSVDTVVVSGVHDFERHVDVAQVPFILASTGQRERFWFWREEEDTGFTNVNVDWKRQFAAPGHEVRASGQYTRGREDEQYFLNEVSRVREGTDRTHLVATEHTLPIGIDYTRPLRHGRVELGSKLQRRWIPVSYEVGRGEQTVIYDGLGESSDWDEDIYAVYANLVRVQAAYSLEAGLRVEQTNVAYTIPAENIYYQGSDRYDYFGVFPNVKGTWRIDGVNRVTAAYNRRVDRPGEPELRIFPKYDDPELLKVGNPYLRPQFTHATELGYTRSWTRGSTTAAAYRRDVSDAFLRIFAIDDSDPDYDVVNRLYQNAGNYVQTGVQVLADHAFSPRWRVAGSVNWFVNDVGAFETTLLFPTARPFTFEGSNDDTWDAKANTTIVLPRAAELQLGYVYYAARNVPQGRERARSSFDVSAKWPFANDRAEVLFTFTDVFNDFGLQREIEGQGFRAVYQNYLESQVATVALRFRF